MLIGIKYNVPSQGKLGENIVWRVYEHLNETAQQSDKYNGPNIQYVEHVDVEDVDSWTGNNIYYIGYSLVVEGNIEYYIDSETGLRHARIHGDE